MPAEPGKERGLQEVRTELPFNPFLWTLETSPSEMGTLHTSCQLHPGLHKPLTPDAQACWESNRCTSK